MDLGEVERENCVMVLLWRALHCQDTICHWQ